MSANLDLVRSIYADWERGDFSRTDWADPEMVYVRADGLERGEWHGVSEARLAFGNVLSAWQEVHAGADEYRVLDDDTILVTDRFTGRGRTSGIELAEMRTQGATLWHVRRGRVTRLVIYRDRVRALADLGLEESAVSEESGTPTPVELMRRGYEALNRRDFDAFVSFYAPDAVVEARTVAERFEGRAAIRGFIEEFWSAFEQYQAKPDEILDLGHGVVFVTNRVTARLPESDAELQMRDGQVYESEEGMVVRAILDLDVDAARAAAERLAKERG